MGRFSYGLESRQVIFSLLPLIHSLIQYHTGKLSNRQTHDLHWSLAEQSCTDYGANVLAPQHNAKPSDVELLWFKFSEIYRWVLRNESAAISAIGWFPFADGLILWFTDVTNFNVARTLTQLAWDFSKTVSGILGFAVDAGLFVVYAPVIIAEYVKEKGLGWF